MDAKCSYKFISISIDWISRIILTAIEKILNVFLFKYIIIQRTVHIFRYRIIILQKLFLLVKDKTSPASFCIPSPSLSFTMFLIVFTYKNTVHNNADHCTVQYQYLNIARYLILFIMELHKDAFIVLLSWSFINKIWKFV